MGPVELPRSRQHGIGGPGPQRFKVQATDGDIGKVDEASMEVGASQIVVDTGPWIFGRKVLLPAGCIERIDLDDEKVYVDLSKDQIKDSPELSEGSDWGDPSYRESVGTYTATPTATGPASDGQKIINPVCLCSPSERHRGWGPPVGGI